MDIRHHFEKKMNQLEKIYDYPWEDKAFYAAWLTQSYYYSGRVTRILTMASAHTEMAQAAQHKRWSEHAREEKGHEKLAERDVQGLGFTVQEIGEFPITTAFYRAQYYTIQHISVEALMGWVLPLEGLAIHCGQNLHGRIKPLGWPTRFLDVHVNEDPDHVESAFKVLQDSGVKQPQMIIENMDLTVDLYFNILDECKKWSANAGKKRVA